MRFTNSHVWVKPYDDGSVIVGLSKYIKNNLGTILYVDLPEVGHIFNVDDVLAVVESSKTAIEIPSPVFGRVIAVNESLKESVDYLNHDPEGEGYLVIMELLSEQAFDGFLDEATYYLVNT